MTDPQMAKFKTDVPETASLELQIETGFQNLLDENEGKFREVSKPDSARALLRAVFNALDNIDGPGIGLSANRIISKSGVSWDVHFGVDHQMTIICSEADYTEQAPEKIARIILECWDTDWDDNETD